MNLSSRKPLDRMRSFLGRLDDVLPWRVIKWGAYGLLAVFVIGGVLYWTSIPQRAANNYDEAVRLFDNGKYPAALYSATEALRSRGIRQKAYRLRAQIYRAMGQPKDAVADISRVIEQEPDAADIEFRADSYLDLGDPSRAAEDYTKVIGLKNTADAYSRRGVCYLKLRDIQKAVADFSKAIELDPRREYYLQRGLTLGDNGRSAEAISDFDKALELDPGRTMTMVYTLRARATEKRKLGDSAGADADAANALAIEAEYSLGPAKP